VGITRAATGAIVGGIPPGPQNMNKPVENPAEKPVQKLVGKTPFSFRIDLRWCLDELLKDGRLSQRDANQASTTPRTRDQLNWHPLQVVAHFDFEDARSNGSSKLSADVLVAWLAERAEQPVFHIDPIKIRAADITGVMSYAFAERHGILAVQTSPDEVVIASAQPFHTEWMENLQQSLRGRQIRRVVADPADIHRYTIEFYRLVRAIEGANASDSVSQQYVSNFEQLLELGNIGSPDANDQHVVNIVDWLLQYAFDQRASDIHLEPRREIGRVRFRIDGVLHNIYEFPHLIMNAVVSRIKILGRMNVAEKRKPQDGRLKTRNTKRARKPNCVCPPCRPRLAKSWSCVFSTRMCWCAVSRSWVCRARISKSGKSWSRSRTASFWSPARPVPARPPRLYSTLKQLATDEVNVCTIEDPIEMIESSFNQMQVQHNIELDFAEGIRALMRQDPDIIMVGEVRDPETADMAIQAALTGHLVLSTLHTNDAPSSITRLADLGVQPFLIAATVLGVMAQRLVRTLCPHCKVEVDCDEKPGLR
jgi:general secretion pathway protein E